MSNVPSYSDDKPSQTEKVYVQVLKMMVARLNQLDRTGAAIVYTGSQDDSKLQEAIKIKQRNIDLAHIENIVNPVATILRLRDRKPDEELANQDKGPDKEKDVYAICYMFVYLLKEYKEELTSYWLEAQNENVSERSQSFETERRLIIDKLDRISSVDHFYINPNSADFFRDILHESQELLSRLERIHIEEIINLPVVSPLKEQFVSDMKEQFASDISDCKQRWNEGFLTAGALLDQTFSNAYRTQNSETWTVPVPEQQASI